jgi:hypothetical protein
MIQFDPEIIKSFGINAVADIRQSMDDSGVTASGKFNKSLKLQLTDKEIVITGLKYAGAIESGRKPGGVPSVSVFREWIDVKRIIPDSGNTEKDKMSFAWAVRKTVEKKGTLLHRGTDFYGRSKPSRVIRGVVKDGRIEELGSDLMINYVKQIKSELFDGINSNG